MKQQTINRILEEIKNELGKDFPNMTIGFKSGEERTYNYPDFEWIDTETLEIMADGGTDFIDINSIERISI